MNRLKTILPICLMGILLADTGAAQTSEKWRKVRESSTTSSEFRLVQTYTGTIPGAGNALPRVEELNGRDGSWITWPGFMLTDDGGSRLFLQTTAPVSYKEKRKGRTVTLTIQNSEVFLANNRNPLLTMHFNTPLQNARLRKRQSHVELVLTMKTDAPMSISQAAVNDGYSYLFIDFPPGTYPTGSTGGSPGGSGGRLSFSSDDIPPSLESAPESPQVIDDETPFR